MMNGEYRKVAAECGAVVAAGVVYLQEQQFETYTSRILASQQAAHEAEIARLKEENQRVKTDSIVVVETLKADLAAACAMKDEALAYAIEDLTLRAKLSDDDSLNIGQGALYKMHEALSASPQQVSEWERKQLEPLRDEIAELKMELDCAKNRVCSEIATLCAAGTDFIEKSNQSIPMVEIQAAEDVLRAAISNTQATAKQLEPLRTQADYDQSVIRGLVDDSSVLSKQVISLRHALAYVLGSKDDEKIGWRSSTATDKDVFRCEFCAKQHEDCTLIEHQEDCPVTVARLALANTQATAEQFIAECEQRGAIKALEDAAKEMQHRRFELPSEASDELLEMIESINATSKKAE